MRRREVIAGLLFALAPFGTARTQGGKIFRLGVLALSARQIDIIRSVVLPELRRRGFVEGTNLVLDFRAGADSELPRLADELVMNGASAILAITSIAVRAALARTTTIPIVMFGGEDGIIEGYATTLARPGSNVTAVVIMTSQLDSKRLDLLHETLPSVRRLAALVYDDGEPGREKQKEALRRTAEARGLQLRIGAIRTTREIASAFADFKAANVQALIIAAHSRLFQMREELAATALDAHLPTVCEWDIMARDGCLIGYGPDREALYRAAAGKLARIFGGTAPAELPVEQPAGFRMAINMQVAKALSLEVPPSILARADEVIE